MYITVKQAAESLLTAIDRKKIELDPRRPLTEGGSERLTEEFVVEYTYNSNAIEGNTLTLRETDMVLRGLTIDRKPLKDHMEAVGHKEAFDLVRNLVKDQVPLSESIIKQIDLVVTGCSSGQGMMIACNRLPGMICGYVENPQDAFLFGRINDGNAVSIPLGLNFGWAGEINLQCTLEKLFEGGFGIGYPPEDADRKKEDILLLKKINVLTKRNAIDVFERLDKALIQKVMKKTNVIEYILEHGTDKDILEFIRHKR